MSKKYMVAFGAVLLIGASLSMQGSALAQSKGKKVSFQQAWKLCKAALDKESAGLKTDDTARYARGGACLAKYGYSF